MVLPSDWVFLWHSASAKRYSFYQEPIAETPISSHDTGRRDWLPELRDLAGEEVPQLVFDFLELGFLLNSYGSHAVGPTAIRNFNVRVIDMRRLSEQQRQLQFVNRSSKRRRRT